jgi:SAM-dependent methyltransferase
MPHCPICGSPGSLLHAQLRDRLFGVPGEWRSQRCQNDSCETVWLDPCPLPEDIHLAYRTFTTHRVSPEKASGVSRLNRQLKDAYLNRRYGYALAAPAWARAAATLLPWIHPGGKGELDAHSVYLPNLPEKGTVLEVGCGNGEFLARLQTIGWNVIGTDVDPLAIQLARTRGIDARLGELMSLQLPTNSVDAVLLHHVIEHMHNPREILNECMRIVRPGGKLVLVTPNNRSLGHHIFGPAWYPLDPPRHVIIFSLSSLTTLLRESGCKLERAETTSRGARSYFHLSFEIVRRHQTDPFSRAGRLGALAGIGFQFFERLSLLFQKNLGEEIVTVAQKVTG